MDLLNSFSLIRLFVSEKFPVVYGNPLGTSSYYRFANALMAYCLFENIVSIVMSAADGFSRIDTQDTEFTRANHSMTTAGNSIFIEFFMMSDNL